ncbi:serine/threonine protein kinase [Pseudonocardia thermophila]|uniref:Serine/threonine protein kinase n=1 Tax=Pseudonocardia thermophila TaxID=1848 RepID=A0A1M6ZBK4_PSETH|nr:serine/threonine protein kinase [Pseudonocardia thermophila]
MVDLARAGFTDAVEVGRGGFGVVYRCRQEELNRTVAVKLLHTDLDQTSRERFFREGRAMGGLSGHPNVVDVLQVGVTPSGRPFIVMPYQAMDSLAARVRREGPIGWAEATRIGVRLAGALESAHRVGTLHRDIKPGNVLMSDYGEAQLTDFGIARIEGGFETATGAFTGSLSYSAPEVLNGHPPSPQSDIYSLAATLFSIIAGRAAFERREGEEIIAQFLRITGQPIPDLRVHGVPDVLCEVLERAMAKNPADRPPTAEAFGRELQEVQRRTGQPVAEMALPATRRPSADVTETAGALDERSPSRVSRSFELVEKPWGPATATEATQLVPPRPLLPGPPYRNSPSGPSGPLPPWQGGTGPSGPYPPSPVGPTIPDRPPEQPGGKRRRLQVVALVAVAVLFLGALSVGGIYLLRGRGGEAPPAAAGAGTDPASTALTWSALTDVPLARQQVATTIADGVIWVIGGLTNTEATAAVQGYDAAINAWKDATPLPVPLHHEMATTYNGQIVVLGGWQPSGAQLNAIENDKVYALASDRWTELPKLPGPRVAGGAVTVGNKIVVAGGQAGDKLVTGTDVFDGTKWVRGADIPTPREHLAMVSDGRYAYAIGGRALSSDKNSDAVERYDPETDTWTKLAPLPSPRGGIGAAYADGRIIVAGGEAPASVIDRVDQYDIAADSWSPLPSMKTPRHGLALAAVGGTVYAFGGAAKPSHEASVSVAESLVLPPRRLGPAAAWRTTRDAPIARQFTGSAVVDGRMWVVGGLTTNEATAAVYAYDAAIDTWTRGPDLPIPLHHVMAVNYRDELWVLGGWTPEGGNESGRNSDRVFALRNGAWVEMPKLLRPRVAAAAAVVGDKLVLFGGQTNGQLTRETEVFDGTAWHDAAPIPTPREHLAGAAGGGFVYAVGGRELSSSKNLPTFERYDPATDTWTSLPPMPTARGGLGAACFDGRVVAAGGELPRDVLGTVEAFDVDTGLWTTLAPLGVPRHGFAFDVIGNSIYAVGGAQKPTHAESTARVEVLDFT